MDVAPVQGFFGARLIGDEKGDCMEGKIVLKVIIDKMAFLQLIILKIGQSHGPERYALFRAGG
jgi:hypothetical protein